MSLLTGLFLLPVLQSWVLHQQDHEASPWRYHENTTAEGAWQFAQWGGYLENVNFLHVLYVIPSVLLISQPLPLHRFAPLPAAAGDHVGVHGPPLPHHVPPAPQRDPGAPNSCPLTPPKGLPLTRVNRSAAFLHRLTRQMLSTFTAKPCCNATHKISLSALTDLRTKTSWGWCLWISIRQSS